jgi:predicted ATPase
MMVAVTGGPCGGKTTALVELAEELPKLGVAVMRCPELSTLLFGAGAAFPGLGTRAEQLAWDYHKLRAQLALEDTLCSIAAESAQPTMVLMDRGALDSKAFVATGDEAGQHAWEQLLERGGWDEASLLSRYDAVIHLVTTAIGAEEHYSGAASNAARREDVAEAQAQDLRIRTAWQSHPKFCLVSNEHVSSFDEKLRHATAFLYQQEHFLNMITMQSDQTIER